MHSSSHSLKFVYNTEEGTFLSKEPVNENSSECRDPLQNLGDGIEPKFYRVECVVFAEPLALCTDRLIPKDKTDSNVIEKVEDVVLNNDNVTVTKRSGKRKQYVINSDLSDLTCPQKHCKKLFASTALLRSHIRKVHCADKDYVCEQCGASFTAQYLLKRHYSVHSGDKVQCPVCKKMLSKRSNMTVHLRSHADTRPHECTACHKRFLRRSTLNVHISYVHKETRPQDRSAAAAARNPQFPDQDSRCAGDENDIN